MGIYRVAARSAGPEFAQFLTRHISDTVKNCDSKQMSEQLELNIGKDLQFRAASAPAPRWPGSLIRQ
jgi:uncharacterized membrane-anchored protein YjiN (DUF445 family)